MLVCVAKTPSFLAKICDVVPCFVIPGLQPNNVFGFGWPGLVVMRFDMFVSGIRYVLVSVSHK